MTWLKPYERDPDLPAQAGDPELVPPSSDALLELVRASLVRPGIPSPSRARLELLRWKPGVSITAGYTLGWEDGVEQEVVLKRYKDGKAREIESSFEPDARARRREERLQSFAPLPEIATCLYAFPADRALPGAARLLHTRRTARLLNALPFDPRLRIRGSRSSASLLRYKPERRAVFRLDLVQEDKEGRSSPAALAARALPPAEAARVVAARRSSVEHSAEAIGPHLVLFEERTGILLEEWIDVEIQRSADFSHAPEAGMLVARLHALPLSAPPRAESDPFAELRALFSVEPGLMERSRALRAPRVSRATAWIHGDLHPDQVARERTSGAMRLLDLDSLSPGHPSEDLATWVADHIAVEPAIDALAAARPLLEGYRTGGGTPPAEADLLGRTGIELVRLAAAGLRRLEHGAVGRAQRLLTRAEELLCATGVGS